MSRARATETLVLGAEPRVDLLPPEVYAQRKAKGTRRALLLGVVGVVLIVLLATAGAGFLAIQAQSSLVDAQNQTSSLLAQQTKLMKVRTVQNQIKLVEAAQQVGSSTEIDWKSYLDSVQSALPPTVGITTVTVDSASPLATYAQPTTPLLGARVATVTFTATSPTLPEIPPLLTSLTALPGAADASLNSLTLDTTKNVYTVTVTMHVNDSAFAKRFATKGK